MSPAWRLLVRRVRGVMAKELTELVRQPALLLILVIGPLLILLVFGAGVRPTDPAVRSIFVAPADDPVLAELVADYADTQSERLTITDVTTERDEALAALSAGRVDLVVLFPGSPLDGILRGERSAIEVRHRFIDPLESQAIQLFATGAVDDLNDILLREVLSEIKRVTAIVIESIIEARDELPEPARDRLDERLGQGNPLELGITVQGRTLDLQTVLDLDPGVIAVPLEGEATPIAGRVTTSQFYAPAVVALILQHLTVTFVALARTRERELGTEELLAVSPLRPAERVLGQSLAYVVAGLALGAALIGVVVGVLGAPLRGGVLPIAAVIGLLLLASIGVGLLLARLTSTTTQVVQGAMLILLLSVFFGGLLLSPERLQPWTRPVGAVLPMSHALVALRDSMLRGLPLDATPLLALTGIGVGLIGVVTWSAGRRSGP